MAEKYFYSIIFLDTELNKALQKIIFYLQTRDCAENKVRTKRWSELSLVAAVKH